MILDFKRPRLIKTYIKKIKYFNKRYISRYDLVFILDISYASALTIFRLKGFPKKEGDLAYKYRDGKRKGINYFVDMNDLIKFLEDKLEEYKNISRSILK